MNGTGVLPPVASVISAIETILEEARTGRPYVLVGPATDGGHGCWVVPAQFATSDQLNAMARHASGLICLALCQERARRLRLPLIGSPDSLARRGAFTVSIEAREGVTTGISTLDRAQTIRVAIDPAMGPEDIVSPGHVFPLVASDGGVLVKAGQAEAAVDIARLAGLQPAGVICEIVNPQGAVANLDELVELARLHGLKIGSIPDLIAYRRRTERQIQRLPDPDPGSVDPSCRLRAYRSVRDGAEHLALARGEITLPDSTWVLIHRADSLRDLTDLVGGRQTAIAKGVETLRGRPGPGVILVLRDAGRVTHAGRPEGEAGDLDLCAQILGDLGVGRMCLAGEDDLDAFRAHGLLVERA